MVKTTTSKLPQYVYRLRNDDDFTFIAIGRGDRNLLEVYKNIDRKSMRAVLHDLIGFGAKCREEKHVQVIEDLKERLRIATTIAASYLRKYGKIRPEKT